jgi:excisionase family DNA binding protein
MLGMSFARGETTVAITDLTAHPEPYVTVAELARYWGVNRRLIYKQIEAGTLESVRLGPRLYRIRTCVAREFERIAKMQRADHVEKACG